MKKTLIALVAAFGPGRWHHDHRCGGKHEGAGVGSEIHHDQRLVCFFRVPTKCHLLPW